MRESVSPMSVSIRYDTEELEFSSEEAENLLRLAIKKKLPISFSCEGNASCGTCRVIVTKGVDHLPPRNALEQEMADDRDFKAEERLACQLDLDDLTSGFSFKFPQDQ